ncbi:hypothetical protein HCCG_00319 [Helicobacter cinaedi CCUG 18818 = ATCC BAA-847]|uniref:Uncharacterized protein n=1 Tax=Helicobacter cinaedi CCUG 18818 = ATCC BAA-847 TaxID=537971 RepID=A0ABN0B8F7_9HELI|nr:hypothetical protein HCCG_00319 [Helicobacter cinaedi CCUG 18818 = ATCC BAA-847]
MLFQHLFLYRIRQLFLLILRILPCSLQLLVVKILNAPILYDFRLEVKDMCGFFGKFVAKKPYNREYLGFESGSIAY